MCRLPKSCLPKSCRYRTIPYPKRRFASNIRVEKNDEEDFGDYSIILPEEPFVFGTSHIKPRFVPGRIERPNYVGKGTLYQEPGKIQLGTDEEVRIREAAALAKKVRDFAKSLVHVGITTNAIDSAVHDFIIKCSAYPSPLLYQHFPRSCCTSVNNIIAHGIPDDRKLENGDIINIDITVFLNGYHGDTSKTFLVGDVDYRGSELVDVTNIALERAIDACGPGRPFNGIGKAIHNFIRNKHYSVSNLFTGHGIGKVFHSAPWIKHHLNDSPGVMEPGHCFTIEPAIVQGTNPEGWIFPDGWTASTVNCARSACAEHMILITEKGADILTR